MLCSNCGAECDDTSKFCGQCGADLPSASTDVSVAPPPPLGTQLDSGNLSASNWASDLRIALVFVWTAFLTFTSSGFSAESLGFWIGTLFWPAVIAYLVTRGWRTGNRAKFSYWFLALGLILPTLTHQSSLSNLSHSDLIKELSGAKPLEGNLPENQREMAAVTTQFFADMRAARKSYYDQLALLQPDLGALYTAGSFANKDSIQRSLNAVNSKLALDRELSETIQQWPNTIRARLDKTDLSDSEKKKFLTGFNKSFGSSNFLAARQVMIVAESDWAKGTDDLYSFSLLHASQIVVAKEKLAINSDSIRDQFNAKLTRSEQLRDAYVTASKKVDEIRAANMKQAGVTPADVGLDK
jgi:hypothetical protein